MVLMWPPFKFVSDSPALHSRCRLLWSEVYFRREWMVFELPHQIKLTAITFSVYQSQYRKQNHENHCINILIGYFIYDHQIYWTFWLDISFTIPKYTKHFDWIFHLQSSNIPNILIGYFIYDHQIYQTIWLDISFTITKYTKHIDWIFYLRSPNIPNILIEYFITSSN
jgi:hypothetical protein